MSTRGQKVQRIQTFGSLELVTEVGALELVYGHQSTLVARLAASSRPVVDEAVLEWLWPDGDPTVGRRRLRNLLNRLHTRSGPVIERIGPCLALSANLEVDLRVFYASARSALTSRQTDLNMRQSVATKALALSREGFAEVHTYDDWAIEVRDEVDRIRERLSDLL